MNVQTNYCKQGSIHSVYNIRLSYMELSKTRDHEVDKLVRLYVTHPYLLPVILETAINTTFTAPRKQCIGPVLHS